MGKKKKPKYSFKQIVIYSVVFAGIIAIGFFIDKKKEENQSEEIKNGNFKVYGMVEKLKSHSLKGKGLVSRKDVLYLYYEKNDTIFHLIKDLPDGQIEKLGIELNDCFTIRVAESDNDVFDIDFNKKLDTLIDKNDFEYQIYQTDIHKNIIE
ncbi:hypothetical protein [Winogradskyella sp. SM1960]|uniref:hypothetical protein n=1 Tax=Winogradskyella sp. SM1960 TaxID=2865955 RepID=UPI001CD71277|nr:hypothetical protein [Winogradskyella sp. SM1960]